MMAMTHERCVRDMIKELCKDMKKLIRKKLWKVLVGVLSCCMLLNGCGNSKATQISWQMEEEKSSEVEAIADEEISKENVEENLIYVYLCGAVANPGVYQIAEGSRLFEALEAAGGMLEEADLTSQNLARILQDGEQIQILTKDEVKALEDAGISVQGESITKNNGLININTASVQELTTLTGIGESRAQAIIEYRETNGFFTSIDGIKNVSGIKDALFEKIKNQITV